MKYKVATAGSENNSTVNFEAYLSQSRDLNRIMPLVLHGAKI